MMSPSATRRFAGSSNAAGWKGICSGRMPRACRSAAARCISCWVSISISDFGSSSGVTSSSAWSAWLLTRASTRFAASRSTLARTSLFIFATSPSATPRDFANAVSSSGRRGSSTDFTVTRKVASLPATSLP
jgi:hypothetical protein